MRTRRWKCSVTLKEAVVLRHIAYSTPNQRAAVSEFLRADALLMDTLAEKGLLTWKWRRRKSGQVMAMVFLSRKGTRQLKAAFGVELIAERLDLHVRGSLERDLLKERERKYRSLEEVERAYTTNSDEYRAAALAFSKPPRPDFIARPGPHRITNYGTEAMRVFNADGSLQGELPPGRSGVFAPPLQGLAFDRIIVDETFPSPDPAWQVAAPGDVIADMRRMVESLRAEETNPSAATDTTIAAMHARQAHVGVDLGYGPDQQVAHVSIAAAGPLDFLAQIYGVERRPGETDADFRPRVTQRAAYAAPFSTGAPYYPGLSSRSLSRLQRFMPRAHLAEVKALKALFKAPRFDMHATAATYANDYILRSIIV